MPILRETDRTTGLELPWDAEVEAIDQVKKDAGVYYLEHGTTISRQLEKRILKWPYAIERRMAVRDIDGTVEMALLSHALKQHEILHRKLVVDTGDKRIIRILFADEVGKTAGLVLM